MDMLTVEIGPERTKVISGAYIITLKDDYRPFDVFVGTVSPNDTEESYRQSFESGRGTRKNRGRVETR